MATEFDRVIYCGLFRGKRGLIIKKQFLFFEKNTAAVNPAQAFGSDEITGYRYEVQWIRFRLTFGRRYVIRVKNSSGKILTIKMTRYFRIGANAAHTEFNEIVSTIRHLYFDRVIDKHLEHHQNDQVFSIENVIFSKEGITIPTEFKVTQPVFLTWEDIRTKNYHSYFAVYAASDPRNKNFSFSYANDWNTSILYSVLRTILKQKNIETY